MLRPQPADHRYLPTLDGWRALSILSVMLAHSFDRISTGWVHEFSRNGAFGVDIFFAISGFLITTRLLDLKTSSTKSDLIGFYIRRFFRIVPPYAALLFILTLLLLTGTAHIALGEIISSALFVRNYFHFDLPNGWYSGHLWSIAVEEHFYLLFPGALYALGMARRRAFFTLIVCCLMVAFWRNYNFHQHSSLGIAIRTDTRLDSLLWGSVMAIFLQLPEAKKWIPTLTHYGVWLVASVAWILLLLYRPAGSTFLLPIITPLLIIGTVRNPQWLVGKLLETKPFLFIGRISYSLYLWNSLFMVPVEANLFGHGLDVLQSFPLQWVCTFACAIASYYWIEKPFIKLGYRIAPPMKTSTLSANGINTGRPT